MVGRVQRATKWLVKSLWDNFVEEEFGDFYHKYGGYKRRAYELMHKNMSFEPEMLGECVINAFVKNERTLNPLGDPRIIQYRGRMFNILAFKYLRPIEHSMLLMTNGVTPLFAKGRNQVQRGLDIYNCWRHFPQPVCVGLDCSRFDQHHTLEMLDVELGIYRQFGYPDYLSSKQRYNHGYFRCGEYHTTGLRMSGDANTSLGNCLTVVAILHVALEGFPHLVYDDGDDCLVFCSRNILEYVKEAMFNTFTGVGHELKFERISFTFSDITFCQSSPIYYGDQPVMVRDPLKTVSALLQPSVNPTTREGREYMSCVALSLLNSNIGVPLVTPLCRAILSYGYSTSGDPYRDVPYEERMMPTEFNIYASCIPEQVYERYGDYSDWDYIYSLFTFPNEVVEDTFDYSHALTSDEFYNRSNVGSRPC